MDRTIDLSLVGEQTAIRPIDRTPIPYNFTMNFINEKVIFNLREEGIGEALRLKHYLTLLNNHLTSIL